MSDILNFFIDNGTDYKGRTLDEILNMSDTKLEVIHNIIQWVFPLHEKSYHAVDSPVLSEEDIQKINSSIVAKSKMLCCINRFCSFFGIDLEDNEYDKDIVKHWCHDGNHNLLRITRIIRSLRLFGEEDLAKKFYSICLKIANENNINSITLEFWRKAMFDNLLDSLTNKFLKIKEIRL
jgi:hypothetical protein